MGIWNTLKATVLLAALTGLFVLAGSAIGGRSGMVIALPTRTRSSASPGCAK